MNGIVNNIEHFDNKNEKGDYNMKDLSKTHLVIPQVDNQLRNLFVGIADIYNLDRESLLKNMMLPYVNMVIRDLESQPDCKTEILDQLQFQINQIFYTGSKGDFLS